MKARLIVAGIGIPLLLVVLLVLPKIATAVLVALICGFAAYELLFAAGFVKNLRILVMTIAMAVFLCLWSYFGTPGLPLHIAVVVYVLYLFVELLLADTKLDFRNLCVAMFGGLVIPYFLSSVVRILCMDAGRYLVLAPFVMTMAPDSGAFQIGRKYGKHKLAPHISPKKSVEGVIGGVVCGILGMLLYAFILQRLGLTVNYLYAALYGLIGALGSVAGDLVFSTIKRQHGIKDFGHLLPGHGGALDRFDSTTFVAPLCELLLLAIPMAVMG